MSLLDKFAGIEDVEVVVGPRCTFVRIKHDVSEAEFGRLTEILNNRNISSAEIARRLTDAGYRVAPSTVERHRKRGTGDGCRCPK